MVGEAVRYLPTGQRSDSDCIDGLKDALESNPNYVELMSHASPTLDLIQGQLAADSALQLYERAYRVDPLLN